MQICFELERRCKFCATYGWKELLSIDMCQKDSLIQKKRIEGEKNWDTDKLMIDELNFNGFFFSLLFFHHRIGKFFAL